MMSFRGTRLRHPVRTCKVCGNLAPRDAIRLRGGQFYCPQGTCRRVAEGIIRAAWARFHTRPDG